MLSLHSFSPCVLRIAEHVMMMPLNLIVMSLGHRCCIGDKLSVSVLYLHQLRSILFDILHLWTFFPSIGVIVLSLTVVFSINSLFETVIVHWGNSFCSSLMNALARSLMSSSLTTDRSAELFDLWLAWAYSRRLLLRFLTYLKMGSYLSQVNLLLVILFGFETL